MNLLVSSSPECILPEFLRDLTSVVIALLSYQGDVLAANQGFLYVAALPTPPKPGWNVRDLFINPTFDEIAEILPDVDSKVLYQGMLNIGPIESTCHSLKSKVYLWSDHLLVVAEHDIIAQEQLSASVLELNEELANMQRKLVRANRELKRNEAVIRELINTDPLTGVANRRRLDEFLAAEIERCRRYHQPLSLIMTDLDHFKQVNDNYGHDVGDEVLKHFAGVLSEQTRKSDLVARYGGEEFIVVLPEISLERAVKTAERLRSTISENNIPPLEAPVTASFGVAMLASHEDADSLQKRADEALYGSKAEGRNRVTLSDPS